MPDTITAKKQCCHSSPRCKSCPVVMRRLERAGLLERISKRRWRVRDTLPKKAVRKARGKVK